MCPNRSEQYIEGLVSELTKLPKETEWVEFKENNDNPQEIGQYISALSNSAALLGKAHAYLVWGISDENHAIVGTTVSPSTKKIGNEELENWLTHTLNPRIHIRFYAQEVAGERIVVLEIDAAQSQPVKFSGEEYIRVGSYKKPLREHPEKERELWMVFNETPFERLVTVDGVSTQGIVQLLDYESYFELLGQPVPANDSLIVGGLEADGLVVSSQIGSWDITNLGALLFARNLDDFRSLRRKTMRVVRYTGTGREDAIDEWDSQKGYANGFEELVHEINGRLPTKEVVGDALRKAVPVYPELAVRELVANALIHQDLAIVGAGPMIEIFSDRVEITNPGEPLVDTDRFIDLPPRSPNELLASLMRRIGTCEERGSGWDKIVFQSELHRLPAPLIEVLEGSTRVVLFSPRDLGKMDKEDRIRVVYLHACLRYVNRESLTNATIRERFGIDKKNSATASRLIKEATDAGVITVADPEAGNKAKRYLPSWAMS